MTIPSPCISVCVTDPGSDLCYGCARTTPEIAKWSKFTDDEKKQVIEISRSRMSGWQLEAFDKACLLYTSPSPRDMRRSRMPSSA